MPADENYSAPDPIVSTFGYGSTWSVNINNVYEMNGVTGYFLYDPDNPPMEVAEGGSGSNLQMSEQEARSIYAQLGKILSDKDGINR